MPAINNFAGTAQRLIRRHGLNCTHSSLVSAIRNPVALTVMNSYTDQTDVKMFPVYTLKSDLENPAFVSRTLQSFIVAQLDMNIAPKAGDKITNSLGTFTIERVQMHVANNANAMWRIVSSKS